MEDPTHGCSALLQRPLLIPSPSNTEERHAQDEIGFFSLLHRRSYSIKDVSRGFSSSRCVGSSHGWLVLLDHNSNPYLLNPCSNVCINCLPPKEALPHTDAKYGKAQPNQCLITKAILSSDPISQSGSYCRVVVIYGLNAELAFCGFGDRRWTHPKASHQAYCDIICHDNRLCALSDWGSVEVWKFQGSMPVKIQNVEPYSSVIVAEREAWNRDLYTTRFYLVEAGDELLLLMRFVGEFVDADGVPVYEADLLTEESTQPRVCPYRTLKFRVYKLMVSELREGNGEGESKWVEVESLDNWAVFVGGNESVAVSAREFQECKPNSIYFSDDYWDRVDEDYLYGGHDMGVFNLQDGSVEPICECDYLQKK